MFTVRAGAARFIGESGETKPTRVSIREQPEFAELDVGSTLFESDTGNLYIFDGAGWRLTNSPGCQLQILEELRCIRTGVERANELMEVISDKLG